MDVCSTERSEGKAPPAVDAGALIRRRLSGFVQVLRDNGFAVGLGETADALRLLAAADLGNRAALLAGLRALLASRRSDWEKFAALFDAYWFARHLRDGARIADPRPRRGGPRMMVTADDGPESGTDAILRTERRPDGEGDDAPAAGHERGGTSDQERLARTDFRHILDPVERERVHALARRLAAAMRARLTRRHEVARNGSKIDLRRSLHRSVARGGLPLELVYRRRRTKPLKLVILLDASGSMSPYVTVFVRFMHGVLDSFRQAAAFVFHTRLADVTDAMREKDPQRAVDRLGLMAQGVGGGTRIGACLATFNRWHAARIIHSRTAVLIVSDGYDTGEPAQLASEMAALRRRCRRIAWLNPMIGWHGYEPVAAGMRAALPYVDLFAPAHSIESLEALEPYLARL
ncbi:VWA domain-containing protein [Oleomonas cavernae]|uniref:VWA domain-containing protein n=1 Tax=Oleomonas cavernae TaxID=2320859 RepID=A0A418WIG2_9PROT|nr:VWA domain-containing protein [Oleomonas cavernae]RJF89824.1 VWA domain-containing protein [Oleomonas cavernae]